MPYHTQPTLGVQCADSLGSSRVLKRTGPARLSPIDAFGTPIPCTANALSNASLAKWPKWRLLPKEPALIITSSASCYERARRQANATQLTAERISAVFSTEEGASSCRDTPTQRTYDATAAAHRAAWRLIVQRNTSMAILEEDAEALGDAADMRAAIDSCMEEQCDLAYLGISGDFYGSFAYWATPRAAEYLLRVATKPRCNPHKPDYAMRFACLAPSLVHCLSRPASRGLCDVANLTRSGPPALRCLKPVRVLWRRELEGQGLFAMNHREYAAQTDKSMSNVTSRSEQVAEAREAQCKRMTAKNYHPPAIGQARKP